jgi:phosphoenolpyruvate---glycerone phosphotransferase subunit DhaM
MPFGMDRGTNRVGLVLISHSGLIAKGLAELVRQVAGSDVSIVAIGGAGGSDSELGIDRASVLRALTTAATGCGAVVLMDLGSTVLAVRSALPELGADHAERIVVADAPLIEGAIAAGVAAAAGASLEEVARAAEDARHVRKL